MHMQFGVQSGFVFKYYDVTASWHWHFVSSVLPRKSATVDNLLELRIKTTANRS